MGIFLALGCLLSQFIQGSYDSILLFCMFVLAHLDTMNFPRFQKFCFLKGAACHQLTLIHIDDGTLFLPNCRGA